MFSCFDAVGLLECDRRMDAQTDDAGRRYYEQSTDTMTVARKKQATVENRPFRLSSMIIKAYIRCSFMTT